jgi:aspartate/glutamate racemase
MNCASIMAGMTSHATSEMGLFIHQMIPHHQNEVNMAKALLKTGVSCEDLSNDKDPTCIMEVIFQEIINGQNAQIQAMRGVLEALDEPAYADCVVPVFGLEDIASGTDGSSLSGEASTLSLSNGITFFSIFAGLLLLLTV